MGKFISQQKQDFLYEIILDDPQKRNAMSEEMALEFREVVEKIREDRSIRLLVIRGRGKCFSAGGDLDMLEKKAEFSKEENKKIMLNFYRAFLSLRSLPFASLAAINGHAIGAGLCFSLACDWRYAHKDAKLGATFLKLALHPGMAATYYLPRLVGQAKASELLMSARIISAEEAEKIGLVNKCLSEEHFESEISNLYSELLQTGPQASIQLKESLSLSHNLSLEECIEREAAMQAENYASKEFLEGVKATKEKRKANF